MATTWRTWFSGAPLVLAAALTGCGSGSTPPAAATYTIGGTVAGDVGSGVQLELLRNGEVSGISGELLTVPADGTFTFTRTVTNADTWLVKVFLQPSGVAQWCIANNASGSAAIANVTTVQVNCTTNAFIGGTVTGLAGSGLTLGLFFNPQADEPMSVGADGPFTFAIPVTVVDSWSVAVLAQPTNPAQTCIVVGGSGTGSTSDVTNVQVSCTTDTTAACAPESGTVVTHASNITASEVWAGDGTVHMIPNPISIVAPAIVTVQRCAIVKLANSASIDVRGDPTSHAMATLAAIGGDATHRIRFQNAAGDSTPSWGRLRAFNQYAAIDLEHVDISGGGNLGGSQLNAPLSLNGGSTLPDPLLKVVDVTISAPAGVGIYFSDAAFTADSHDLTINDQSDAMIAMPAMALGSVPANALSLRRTVNEQIKVVENANIFDNLTISTPIPIHFKTDGVHVGGLAPTFVQNVTLTLEAGVVLMFERASTSPTLVTFGSNGQAQDKNAALVVHGTALNPVVFTSALALPLVPGGTPPAPGDWAGLWLLTSNGSQIDHALIEYAGGDASVGPLNCGPIDASIHQQARHTAPLLVGDGTDQQYVPPAGLITNSAFRFNAGNYTIDAVWESTGFGPSLTATNTFMNAPRFCTQPKNLIVGGCVVAGVDQSGCLVP